LSYSNERVLKKAALVINPKQWQDGTTKMDTARFVSSCLLVCKVLNRNGLCHILILVIQISFFEINEQNRRHLARHKSYTTLAQIKVQGSNFSLRAYFQFIADLTIHKVYQIATSRNIHIPQNVDFERACWVKATQYLVASGESAQREGAVRAHSERKQ